MAAKGLGNCDDLIDIFFPCATDLQVHIQAQTIGLICELAQLCLRHLAKAVCLAIEQVQAEALQLVAIGEVQHVGRRETSIVEIGQQGIAMSKQAQLPEPVEQLAGECFGQCRRRLSPDSLVAQ
ncbi:hypothetical protein D3C84_673410 [compost metagenome]